MIVHALRRGSPICAFNPGTPDTWPPDHSWLGFAQFDATEPIGARRCPGCVRIRITEINGLLEKEPDHPCVPLWRSKIAGLQR